MAKKTNGKLYTSGGNGYYYIRYKFEGKETRTRLLDTTGKPITQAKEAQAAADRLLACIHETNKAEQLRTLKNDLRDAEQAAAEAAALLLDSRAAIVKGWRLFMECPKRPASCKAFPTDAIPRNTTAGNYRGYYNRFSAWLNSTRPEIRLLSEITPELAAEFMETIRQNGASGTFNKYLQFFNCFYSTLAGAGKISVKNPFRDIDRENLRYNSKTPLSVEQIAKLLDTATGDLKLLLALGYFTGLRLGDCCTLQWREIDLLRGVIERIPRKTAHTVKDKAQAVVKIGIPPFLFSMLAEIPQADRAAYLLPTLAAEYLAGKGYRISRKIQDFFTQSGIDTHRAAPASAVETRRRAVVDVGFHSLRYSYISHNAEAGTPAAIIQRNAGHSNPAMTEHYTRISDRAAVRYAAALRLPAADSPDQAAEPAPDRAELHRLADTLPLAKVQEILQKLKEI